ncbi:MAG: Uma2 family endonuclease [Treponema sp.]|nr:Uma2 family endonuclease [Treponema sp.]
MSDAIRIDETFDENRRYTYADYLRWESPERYELLGGEAFMMSSPSVAHQAIQVELVTEFNIWLRGKPCRVFAAPLDVRLFPKDDKSDKTVVQPDLLVVCDESKLDKGSVNGPPDLIVEIFSPSNSSGELLRKFNYYLEAGVREYWVVDLETKKVNVHVYENGRYISMIYKDNTCIPVTVLQGLEISLEALWARLP